MSNATLPDWERLLSSAARLQKLESVAGLEEGESSCGACRSASF